jgi:hypothetical protein
MIFFALAIGLIALLFVAIFASALWEMTPMAERKRWEQNPLHIPDDVLERMRKMDAPYPTWYSGRQR